MTRQTIRRLEFKRCFDSEIYHSIYSNFGRRTSQPELHLIAGRRTYSVICGISVVKVVCLSHCGLRTSSSRVSPLCAGDLSHPDRGMPLSLTMSSKLLSCQYYFAFGSNMCLAQMAERCPESKFIGKATLRGYRWQINQRHVANIVKFTEDNVSMPTDQSDVVEGLIFSITVKDRRTLDRKEGIKSGAYERVELDVLLERHPKFADEHSVSVRDKLQNISDAINGPAKCTEPSIASLKGGFPMINSHDTGNDAVDSQPNPAVVSTTLPPSGEHPDAKAEEVKAITYLSARYAKNGLIRQEYVQRMKNAISDAMELDVSRDYVQRHLEPYVHGNVHEPVPETRKELPTSDPLISQKILKERERKAKGVSASGTASSTRRESTTPAQTPDQVNQAHLNSENPKT